MLVILLKGGWRDIWFFQLRRLRESTGGDLSKKEMHTCPSKLAWSAVLKALPLSGDMTSELHSRGKKVMYHFLLCDGRHDMSGASQSSE